MIDKRPVHQRALEQEFRSQRRQLWSIAYRLTGTAEDADDVLQETFVRALATPPPDLNERWLPWLVRVAMNVGRDLLRYRRRRRPGGPIEDVDQVAALAEAVPVGETPEHHYDLLESATLAYLRVLEVLSPTARVVVVLREVADFTSVETAAALGLSEANVRTLHRRARVAMRIAAAEVGGGREPLLSSRRLAQKQFAGLLAALRARDVTAVQALLARRTDGRRRLPRVA